MNSQRTRLKLKLNGNIFDMSLSALYNIANVVLYHAQHKHTAALILLRTKKTDFRLMRILPRILKRSEKNRGHQYTIQSHSIQFNLFT